MDPDGGEIVRAMRTAIDRAERPAESIGYVNYHGTSTQLNDAIEVACVKRVFGSHAGRLPGSSTKSMIGHPQGASGASGLATAALALHRGVLPPTINQRDPDPACDLDFIPNASRPAQVEAALCNCLGFGSKNSAIVLGRARIVVRMVDVLIAGAGPAGSIAAIRLARAGARVLLVDRARFPRDKLCGDTLNPGALRLLDRAGPARARRGGVASARRHADHRQRRRPRARHLRARPLRPRPDAACARSAARGRRDRRRRPVPGRRPRRRPARRRDAAGAPTVRGAVLCRTGGTAARLRVPAQVTIAADGRRSTLAFALGLASHPPAPRRWAVGAYFEGIAGLDTVGEMHVRGPHYIGVAPLGDAGLANVCLVTPAREGFADPGPAPRAARSPPIPCSARAPRGARRVTAPAILGPLAVDARAAGAAGPAPRRRRRRLRRSDDRRRPALRDARRRARRRRGARRARGSRRSTRPARLADARARAFGAKYGVNRLLRRLVGTPRRVSVMAISARVAPGILRQMIRYAGDVAA